MIGSSRLHRKMLETSRVEIDELPASIPWIVFDTVSVSLDSEPSLQHLMEKVAAVIPSKCWAIGFQLGLTTAELQAICPQHQGLENHHRAFGDIFNEWRRRGSPPYTWRTLTGVLRSASVGEVLLSEHLTSWITQQ